MEIIRFLNWAWSKQNIHRRVLILFLSWFLIFILNIFLLNFASALFVFAGGVGLCGLVFIIYTAYLGIKRQWEKYQFEKAYEAEQIVNRLKGYR